MLGFLMLAWAGLLVILVAARAVDDQALMVPTGDRRVAEPRSTDGVFVVS